MDGDVYFVTGAKNHTLDLSLNDIADPVELDKDLKQIPGVLETGLFLNICDIVIIGREKDCEIIKK